MKKLNYSDISRYLISLLFIVSGYGMLMNFGSTAGYFGSLGLPMASLVLTVVLIIKIGGGILFAMGKKYWVEAGYALIAFTVGATIIGHNDLANQINIVMGLKNIAIIGGILACLPLARKMK